MSSRTPTAAAAMACPTDGDDWDHLLRELARKDTTIASLQRRLARLEISASRAAAAARDDQAAASAALAATERKAAAASTAAAAAEDTARAYRAKYKEALRAVRAWQDATAAAEAERDAQIEASRALQAQYAAATRELDELRHTYGHAQEEARDRADTLAQQLHAREAALALAQRRVAQLDAELAAAHRRQDELEQAARHRSALIASLETTVANLEKELQLREKLLRHARRHSSGAHALAAVPAAFAAASPLHDYHRASGHPGPKASPGRGVGATYRSPPHPAAGHHRAPVWSAYHDAVPAAVPVHTRRPPSTLVGYSKRANVGKFNTRTH